MLDNCSKSGASDLDDVQDTHENENNVLVNGDRSSLEGSLWAKIEENEEGQLTVRLRWSVPYRSPLDWIELFIEDLDDERRGIARLNVEDPDASQTMWLLDSPPPFHSDNARLLCFKFYSGLNLSCLAQSEPVIVSSERTFTRERRCQDAPAKQISQSSPNSSSEAKGKASARPQNGTSSTKLEGLYSMEPKRQSQPSEPRIIDGFKSLPLKLGEAPKRPQKEPHKSSLPAIDKVTPEYYPIWMKDGDDVGSENSRAPPLPPRIPQHRPLERSRAVPYGDQLPPRVSRQLKPQTETQAAAEPIVPPRPPKLVIVEDSFQFDLVDTDDPSESPPLSHPFNPFRNPTNPFLMDLDESGAGVEQEQVAAVTSPAEAPEESSQRGHRPLSRPVCPPTPTHHARARLGSPGPSNEDGLLPLRRLSRLPSIPEAARPAPSQEALPPYWEARMDSHGRIFYIDHVNRTTTWQKPSLFTRNAPVQCDQQRQQLDRRYQSIRRTMTSSRLDLDLDESNSGMLNSGSGSCTSDEVSSSEATTAANAIPSTCSSNVSVPSLRFLIRPDFFSILHMHQEALALYNRNGALKHMVSKIRRDPSAFRKYQHNRDLVALVNHFADTSIDLPHGWETKVDRHGKAPQVPPRPSRPMSRSLQTAFPEIPTAYNDKVVAFLRQPNIMDILKERHAPLAQCHPRHPASGCRSLDCCQGLREKINIVRVDGTAALDRLSDDIDLTIVLSLFEQEIMSYVPAATASGRSPHGSPQLSPQASPGMTRANVRAPAPYRRDFETKLRNFYRKLENKGYGNGPGKLKLHVRRDRLLEDAFNKVMAASKKELQKSKLYVSFDREDGLDYGGPSRELFFSSLPGTFQSLLRTL